MREHINTIRKLKQEFNEIRIRQQIGEGKEPMEVYAERVAIELAELLLKHGDIYLHDNTLFYFDGVSKLLHAVAPAQVPNNPFQKMLSLHYNFSMADTNAAKIYSRLYPLLESEAEDAQIYLFSHYKPVENILYIRASDTELFRLSATQVERLPNGTDGVIFQTNPWYEDIEVDLDAVTFDHKHLNAEFFAKIWFIPGQLDAYDKARQATVFKRWFFATFFGTIIQKRPIMILQGATGTGKTSTLKNLGTILFGSKFAETLLPKDERDFINMLTNNHFLILDNIDESPPAWFLDTITSVTTGAMISYRPLYQDATVPPIRVSPQCFIAITSRTPEFNRADVANRAIVNTLGKAEETEYDPVDFEQSLIKNRTTIWQYLLGELQNILRNLAITPGGASNALRMAEFADFCMRSVSVGAEQEYIEDTLSMVSMTQTEFAAQNKPFIEALKDMVLRSPGLQYFTADELSNKLEHGYELTFKSVYQLGRLLVRNEDTLTQFIHFRKVVKGGKTMYEVGKKGDNTLTLDFNG